MEEDSRPGCEPALQLCATKANKLVVRTEFSVFTRAECDLAWKVYCDWQQWRHFCDIYGSMKWRGVPWQAGSRFLVEIAQPLSLKHECLLAVCMPPRCVAWFTQGQGYRVEQWVMFYPYNGGGTRISAWVEFTGDESMANGGGAQQALQQILSGWFARFCRYCNRLADKKLIGSAGDSYFK